MDKKILWRDKVESHDYVAAQDYLELLFSDKKAKELAEKLKESDIVFKKAKDIVRASRLPMLGLENAHVKKNLEKIEKGEKLSPILLVRGGENLIIADGFHRASTIFCIGEDSPIPCKIVTL